MGILPSSQYLAGFHFIMRDICLRYVAVYRCAASSENAQWWRTTAIPFLFCRILSVPITALAKAADAAISHRAKIPGRKTEAETSGAESLAVIRRLTLKLYALMSLVLADPLSLCLATGKSYPVSGPFSGIPPCRPGLVTGRGGPLTTGIRYRRPILTEMIRQR